MFHSLSLASSIGRLRTCGFLEGISFLVLLLIAMPLKYWVGEPLAVRVVGMLHGILFIAYVFLLTYCSLKQKWTLKEWTIGFIGSFLPLGTFYADYAVFLKKQGILQEKIQDN